MHGSANATGTISVDGTANPGDVATVMIEDRAYTYTVVADDTLATIRDRLIDLINQDPKVQAFAAGSFTRIRLRAKIPGPEGNGITFSAKVSDTAQVILSPLNVALCCANAGLVTDDNPAIPGETIILFATGIGISLPRYIEHTGVAYDGPITDPVSFVSSLAGGKTANVLLVTLQPGEVGKYRVDLELNSDLPTNPLTQLTIAQDIYVSNIVTFPVANPNPIGSAATITSLNPSTAKAGSAALTVTVNGTGFTVNSKAVWNVVSQTTTDVTTTQLTTTFVSASQLTATIPASLIATAGTPTMAVSTDGVTSNQLTFTITP